MEKLLKLPAIHDKYDEMFNFIKTSLGEFGFEGELVNKVALASEEILVNIINYAYPESSGDLSIECRKNDNKQGVTVIFTDRGISFDPLAKLDPDITKPVEEREIGGLGIFMVKKLMDNVKYERIDDKNILTIRKNISTNNGE